MITYVVGAIGAGKSAYASKLAYKALKKGLNVYSMTPIQGTKQLTKEDFMKWNIENGLVLVDESGLQFGNRDWKATSKEVITFFKLSRHYGVDIVILSQDGNDTDNKLRMLATRVLLIKPFIRFRRKVFVSSVREVSKIIDVDKNDHQLKEMYVKSPLFNLNFNSRYFKYFNSFECEQFPDKDWNVYPYSLKKSAADLFGSTIDNVKNLLFKKL